MSKITINKTEFLDFLNYCNLKGEIENKELLLNVSETSLTADAVSSNKVVCLRASLKGTFEKWGDLGIDDLALLKNFVNSLSTETITLKKTENKLISEASKTKLSSVLRNPNYIINLPDKARVEAIFSNSEGNEFTLKPEDIKKIISSYQAVPSNQVLFSGQGKTFTVKIDNQSNELVIDFDLATEIKPFSLKLPKLVFDVLNVISNNDVILSIKDNQPALLAVKNKNLEIKYIIAPLAK